MKLRTNTQCTFKCFDEVFQLICVSRMMWLNNEVHCSVQCSVKQCSAQLPEKLYQHSLIRHENSFLYLYAMNMVSNVCYSAITWARYYAIMIVLPCQCYFSCNHLIIVVSTVVGCAHAICISKSVALRFSESVEHLNPAWNTIPRTIWKYF